MFDPIGTLEDARGKLIFCTLPASRTGVVNFIEQELKEQFFNTVIFFVHFISQRI